MTDIQNVTISVTREIPITGTPTDVVARNEALASVLGIDAEQVETEWNWTYADNVPAKPGFRLITDHFVKDTRTNRERLEDIINATFPGALLVFFTDDENMAAVEANNGNMFRVWPTGEYEEYKR